MDVGTGLRCAGSCNLPLEAESCGSPRCGSPVPSGTIPLEEMSWHTLIFTKFQSFGSIPKSQSLHAKEPKRCQSFGEEVRRDGAGTVGGGLLPPGTAPPLTARLHSPSLSAVPSRDPGAILTPRWPSGYLLQSLLSGPLTPLC